MGFRFDLRDVRRSGGSLRCLQRHVVDVAVSLYVLMVARMIRGVVGDGWWVLKVSLLDVGVVWVAISGIGVEENRVLRDLAVSALVQPLPVVQL